MSTKKIFIIIGLCCFLILSIWGVVYTTQNSSLENFESDSTLIHEGGIIELGLDSNKKFAEKLGIVFNNTHKEPVKTLLENIDVNLNLEIHKPESSYDEEFIELIRNPSLVKITDYLQHTDWNDKYSLNNRPPQKAHMVVFEDGSKGIVFYFEKCCGGVFTNLFFYRNGYIYQIQQIINAYVEVFDTIYLSDISFITPDTTFIEKYIDEQETMRSRYKISPVQNFNSKEEMQDGTYIGLIDSFQRDASEQWLANINFLSFKDEVTYPDIFMRYQNNSRPKTFYDDELYMTRGTLLDVTNKFYLTTISKELIGRNLSIIANNQENWYAGKYTYAVLLGADNNGFDPVPDEKVKTVTDDFLSKSSDAWTSVFATTDASMDMFGHMRSRHQAILYRDVNVKINTNDIRTFISSATSPEIENLMFQINYIDLKHGYSSREDFESIVQSNNSDLKLNFALEQLKEAPLYWFIVKNGTITQFQSLMNYRP